MALVQQSSELVVAIGTSGSVTFGANTTAGNLVVLVCFNLAGPAAGFFASSGFTVDATATTSQGIAILSQANVAGGVSSYTIDGSATYAWRCIAYEFDSVATSSHVETVGTAVYASSATPSAAPSGQIDTTTGGPIVAAYSFDRTIGTITDAAGFTGTRTTAHPSYATQGYVAYKVASSASTDERATLTTDGGPNYDAVMVAYKAGGGGSSNGAAAYYYAQQ
jgi:hypothetical protein